MAGNKQELTYWRVRRALHDLGWTGAAGLVAIVFAAGFYVSTVAPLKRQIEQRRDELAAVYARYGESARRAEPASPQNQLDAFYAHLQSQDYVVEVVRKLHRNARSTGLRFERGDYRPQRDASGKVLRYEIALPLIGSYPGVRRFLAQSLDEEPALALDAISFQTESGGGRLETQVSFTLYVRGRS